MREVRVSQVRHVGQVEPATNYELQVTGYQLLAGRKRLTARHCEGIWQHERRGKVF